MSPPAVQAVEEEPPSTPVAGSVRKPLLTVHNPVTPQPGKRGFEKMMLKKGSDSLQLLSPRKIPSNSPGSPGASFNSGFQSLGSSNTLFASGSSHSTASVMVPTTPSRQQRRKGHMDVIEKRITNLVDQVCRLHRDVNQSEQHRYERALNMAEREADVLAHRYVNK